MTDDGGHRSFFTYRNPNPVTRRSKPVLRGALPAGRARRRPTGKLAKPSLWRRIVRFLQQD